MLAVLTISIAFYEPIIIDSHRRHDAYEADCHERGKDIKYTCRHNFSRTS